MHYTTLADNLENISKIIARILVYMLYMMYICTINLKQEQKWKLKSQQALTTLLIIEL